MEGAKVRYGQKRRMAVQRSKHAVASLSMNENQKEEPMAEKEPDKVKCPSCSSRNARVVRREDNFRPRSQTGNLKTDLTPLSTTVSYRCQDQNCGHEWSDITSP